MQSSTKTMSRLLAEAMVVCLLTLTFTPRAGAQEPLDGSSAVSLQRDITLLLLDKDVGVVANQLAKEHTTTVAPLIRQLEIFLRAGHPDRVRQTIAQLAEASDWRSNSHSWFVKTTVTSAIPADDLPGWRFFYERLYPHSFGSEAFLQLWEQQGNPAELDSWLAARSLGNSGWFSLRLARLAKMGRANEVLDPLAAEVKANPRDWSRVERYLRANMMAGKVQDVVWLADVYQAKTACENYELGEWLRPYAPAVAVDSFKKSLTLPFTEPDTVCVQRQFRVSSMPPKVNWEKQLRFWSKRSLAETYQALHRAKEAQPLVEELVAMKDVDIVTA